MAIRAMAVYDKCEIPLPLNERFAMNVNQIRVVMLFALIAVMTSCLTGLAADRLKLEPSKAEGAKHIVLVAGDEEYRTEESMPMLAKILSQKHGFKCTVLFALGPDGAEYIDANNSTGIRGFEELATADLMLIGTRFRNPDAEQAKYVTDFLNAASR